MKTTTTNEAIIELNNEKKTWIKPEMLALNLNGEKFTIEKAMLDFGKSI